MNASERSTPIDHERPTLAELRGRVHKERYREIGNFLARRFARPSAVYGTWLAVRLGISAHQVTLGSLSLSIASGILLATGSRSGFVLAVALEHAAFWLDHVDGQVARWRGTESLDGVYYDYMMHHLDALAVGFGLGFGLAVRTGHLYWTAAGFLIAIGRLFLSVHNDCRYKAFFQRMKRETRSFRVDGGAGGAFAPAPAPGPPARGLALVRWILLKACEPHVVLSILSALVFLSFINHGIWILSLKIYVTGMAVTAPFLAAGRAYRSIRRGAVESEFDRWFKPLRS